MNTAQCVPTPKSLNVFTRHASRRLLALRWYSRVWNDEVLQRTGEVSVSHLLSCRRSSLFEHVARLGEDTPANKALRLHVNTSLSRPSDRSWRRPAGRPRNKWLDHLRDDSNRSTGDLYREHCGNDATALAG